jgi:hypothetical protein
MYIYCLWYNSKMSGNVFNNDSESDSDEDIKNEIPPDDNIDPTFAKNLMDIKHKLYAEVVYSPGLNTPNAQNNKILEKYTDRINTCYILCKDAEKGLNTTNNAATINTKLLPFSDTSKSAIMQLLDWIADFFVKNTPSDTARYHYYITNQLHVYPFMMHE